MKTNRLALLLGSAASIGCLLFSPPVLAAADLPASSADVPSHSYVPIRAWSRSEALGVCPYLFEYGLMKWEGDRPLEDFHAENIRRIDMASEWSTVIQLYNRYGHWRDEIINLMIRCHSRRQLIILNARWRPDSDEKNAYANLVAILDRLWELRDTELQSPEGDRATGRQLINNILAVNTGDEGLRKLGTDGLTEINARIDREIRSRELGGERPFAHIRTWYNEMHYWHGNWAANPEDLEQGAHLWPANSDFIGVDVYNYFDFERTPFDPDDPSVARATVAAHARAWHDVITRYYPAGLRVRIGEQWSPSTSNDTHAMMQAIDLAGADRAMMIFIGLSSSLPRSYTTPVEEMEACYESIRDGPWVGLAWWIFDDEDPRTNCTIDYLDMTLRHFTPASPDGKEYPAPALQLHRDRLIKSRRAIFEDVVYRQFRERNPRPFTPSAISVAPPPQN